MLRKRLPGCIQRVKPFTELDQSRAGISDIMLPESPSTNIMMALCFNIGNHDYGLRKFSGFWYLELRGGKEPSTRNDPVSPALLGPLNSQRILKTKSDLGRAIN